MLACRCRAQQPLSGLSNGLEVSGLFAAICLGIACETVVLFFRNPSDAETEMIHDYQQRPVEAKIDYNAPASPEPKAARLLGSCACRCSALAIIPYE
jgi:hypothetical protein